MPSPFPGMDPYIEKPSLWPNMHASLIAEISKSLNNILPDNYVANMNERIYVREAFSHRTPDVAVSKIRHDPLTAWVSQGATTAVCDEPLIVEVWNDETREPFIELVHITGSRRIVTEIEILSPSNKKRGDKGHSEYREKQQRILDSPCNLLEIDLLRRGLHTVACSKLFMREYGHYDYSICLHRAGKGSTFEIWLRTLRQPLPKIRVPLAGKDPDVIIDLQAIFAQCYHSGRFERNVDYSKPCDPPLNAEDATWAAELLKSTVR